MDTTKKFDGRAKDYTMSRPDYSMELLDCLYGKYELSDASVIADIGSGTGKFSKQLLVRQSEVYCVEPNNEMRREAEYELGKYKNFHSVAGNAENTTLNSNFVDSVTTAQAFHWFDVRNFKQECLRIMKHGGKVFLIWNVRGNEDVMNREWYKVFSKYCPEFRGFSNGMGQDDIKIKAFFDQGYDYVSFDAPLLFDREGFVRRSLSASYSLKENNRQYKSYISALHDLFDKYENNGRVALFNQSVAYIGTIQ